MQRWSEAARSHSRTVAKPDSYTQSWHTAIEALPRCTTSTLCGAHLLSAWVWSRRCTAASMARTMGSGLFGLMPELSVSHDRT